MVVLFLGGLELYKILFFCEFSFFFFFLLFVNCLFVVVFFCIVPTCCPRIKRPLSKAPFIVKIDNFKPGFILESLLWLTQSASYVIV